MSLFRTVLLACPNCGNEVEFEAVDSVNGQRAPHLRAQILAQTFQRETCGKCGESFRLDPMFTYLDAETLQWIAVFPLSDQAIWHAHEEHVREMFRKSFGPGAPKPAQEIGSSLRPRMVFGWMALTEKLILDSLGLDDLAVELTKTLVWRAGPSPEPDPAVELRLVGQKDDDLVFCWVIPSTGESAPPISLPKSVYDEIAADPEGWALVREQFDDALFIDLKRLLIEAPAHDVQPIS